MVASLPVLSKPVIEGDQVQVSVRAETTLKEAQLHFTTDTGLRSKRVWKSITAAITSLSFTAVEPPTDANTWFISATDERDAMVSTQVVIRD